MKNNFKCNDIIDHGEYVELIIDSKTHGKILTKIDKKNYNRVKNFKWSCCGSKPYLYVQTNLGNPKTGTSHKILLHRFITSFFSEMVDHKNGNTLDNTEENLRLCNRQENGFNRIKNRNKKLFKGVTKRKNKFEARITVNNKTATIGYYDSDVEAAIAYNNFAKNLFGDFANENDIKSLVRNEETQKVRSDDLRGDEHPNHISNFQL